MKPQALDENRIKSVISGAENGISEHQLLKDLFVEHADSDRLFTDTMTLFRAHFLLFHFLYRWRNELHKNKSGTLSINPLNIQLRPYHQGEPGLEQFDGLQQFYSNMDNYFNTREQDVKRWLSGFYRRLNNDSQKRQALSALELSEPVDFAAVKRQYRLLSSRYHPDRGGSNSKLQSINAAYRTLKQIMS